MVQKCRKLGHRWTIFWPICLQHSTSCANDKKQHTDASTKKTKNMFFFGKNELLIQEVSNTVAARSFTQLLLPPIGPTAFQCLHVVDSGK